MFSPVNIVWTRSFFFFFFFLLVGVADRVGRWGGHVRHTTLPGHKGIKETGPPSAKGKVNRL